MSIREWRERLQAPRRSIDTPYGRLVMRRLSIYITIIFCRLNVHPNTVNVLSIVVGLCGAWFLAQQHWVFGLLLINGWYLLDHVDGEVARHRNIRGATGLFLDTMANPIIFPATFFALGVGLDGGYGGAWLYVGVAAAYGSVMMSMVPFCESMVVLKRLQQGRLRLPAPKTQGSVVPAIEPPLRKTFSVMHEFITFPVFLPIATAITLFFAMSPALTDVLLRYLLLAYAAAVNVVWIAVVTQTVLTQKIDRQYPPSP